MAAPRRELAARGQLGELFFQIRDPVAIVDSEWALELLNPGGERLLGYSSDLLRGESLGRLFAEPGEYESCVQAMTASLPPGAGEASEAVAVRLRSRAGREFPARVKAFRVGQPGAGTVAVLMQEEPAGDLGDQERALIREVDQMAETARSIVGKVDLGQVCQAFADLAKELVGADFTAVILGSRERPAGEFEITTFAYNAPRHLFPERLPRAVGLLGLALETGAVARLEDIRGHPAGVGIPVQHPPIAALLAVPLIEDGRVIGQLVAANRVGRPGFGPLDEAIARHLGTLVVAGVGSARLQSALAELEKAKSEFLQLASHELRGPLTILGGYCSMLADGSLGVPLPTQVASLMVGQVRQMEVLVDQMLETARLEDGRLDLTHEQVDLAALLQEVVGGFRELSLLREFQVSCPAGPLEVRGDRLRLRSILSILIDNAVKYSPGGEPVVCNLRAGGGEARVEIADHGMGIAASDMPRLFGRFSRISSEGTKGIPGTGLGLYLARELARLHGGEIEVRTAPGVGSTFSVRLPLPV